MKNFGCYAHSLDNCSAKISGEHIVSKSLLGDVMLSSHFGIERIIGKNSYKVKILCDKHNEQLGEWEDQIKQFHIWLVEDASYNEFIDESHEEKIYNFKGEILEKWLLKTAINFKCYMDGKKKTHFNYSWIVKRLFQDISFEFPFGLSQFQMEKSLAHKHRGEIHFAYTYDNDEIYGITINLQGNIFFLCLPTANVHKITRFGVDLNGIIFFPREFIPNHETEESKTPTLLWHPGGIRSFQLNSNGEQVVRSTIIFHWKENKYLVAEN